MSVSLRLGVVVIGIAVAGLISPAPTAAASTTSTTLTVTPSSGDSRTEFQISARVTPNPAGGNVRFTIWTAQTGGSVNWDHTFPVNANGIARVPDGINLNPGTRWWQAEFLGTSGFAASTSTRLPVLVTGIATAVVDASVTWSDGGAGSVVTWAGRGQTAANPSDTQHNGGALELVVDGEVYASCSQWSSATTQCSAPNKTLRGSHTVFVSFTPSNPRYAASASQTWAVQTGSPLPPDEGVLVERGRFAFNSRDVTIDVAAQDGALGVTQVVLSNSPAVDGGGRLIGAPVAYASRLAWQLLSGADGWRTVYAQLHRSDDSWSQVFADSIFFDTTPPGGTFVINDDAAKIGDAWGGTGLGDQTISGAVTDNSLGQVGAEIMTMAFSNDCQRYRYEPFTGNAASFATTWWIFDDPYGNATLDPGPKTLCGKFRDAAGNWSEVAVDAYEYVDRKAVGHLLIDGAMINSPSPPYTANPTAELTINIDEVPPEGIASIKIYGENGSPDSNDGPALAMTWPADATRLVVTWSLTNSTYGYSSADGLRNVAVRFLTTTGRHQWIGGIVILDRSVATSGVPVPAFALNTVVTEEVAGDGFGASPASKIITMSIDVQWKSGLTNVMRYDLQRLAQGSWTAVTLPNPTATKVRESVYEETSAQFRVQATKQSGQTLAWKTGTPFTATVMQDSASSLTYSGSWRTESRADALGGSLHTTTSKDAFVKLRFTGRAVAWLAPRGPGFGTVAAVYVDGNFVKNVYLSASTAQARRIVFSMSWKVAGTHTIKIKKKYADWTLPVDALLVLK